MPAATQKPGLNLIKRCRQVITERIYQIHIRTFGLKMDASSLSAKSTKLAHTGSGAFFDRGRGDSETRAPFTRSRI
eukprot:scaffold263198_cov17-Tisochrysis_lutea.AAC.1